MLVEMARKLVTGEGFKRCLQYDEPFGHVADNFGLGNEECFFLWIHRA